MKKLPLFILLQLVLICVFVGGLMLKKKSPKFWTADPLRIIIIKDKGGTLIIHPIDPKIYVDEGQHVQWSILPNSNVDSFRLELKPNSDIIFNENVRMEYRSKPLDVNVKYRIPPGKIFDYSIWYKIKKDTTQRVLDPKLAIRPNGTQAFSTGIIITYGILALSIFGVFLNKKKTVNV